MNKKIIPLTYNKSFISILGNPDNIIILENLVSILLEIPIEKIKGNLKMLSRDLKSNKYEMSNQIDLLLKLENETINIEMQRSYSKQIKERNFAYLCKIHGSTLKKGDTEYKKIGKSIQIVFNKDESYIENEFVSRIGVLNEKTYKEYTQNFKIIVINLLNPKLACYNEGGYKAISKMFLAENMSELKESLEEMNMEKDALELILEESDRFSGEDEYTLYSNYTREENDRRAIIDDAKIDGFKQGHEEGFKLGQKQGIQEGIQEGILEGSKKKSIEIAKELLKENMDIDFIIRVTNLTKKEVLELKN